MANRWRLEDDSGVWRSEDHPWAWLLEAQESAFWSTGKSQYLIRETGDEDGYLLEDGSGKILLENPRPVRQDR